MFFFFLEGGGRGVGVVVWKRGEAAEKNFPNVKYLTKGLPCWLQLLSK